MTPAKSSLLLLSALAFRYALAAQLIMYGIEQLEEFNGKHILVNGDAARSTIYFYSMGGAAINTIIKPRWKWPIRHSSPC